MVETVRSLISFLCIFSFMRNMFAALRTIAFLLFHYLIVIAFIVTIDLRGHTAHRAIPRTKLSFSFCHLISIKSRGNFSGINGNVKSLSRELRNSGYPQFQSAYGNVK